MKSREVKRKEAEQRKQYTATLSPQVRLENLDKVLGKNIGARKERTRLQSLMPVLREVK